MKLVRRALLAIAAAVVLAGLAAPFLHADRFRHRVEDALQQALGRQVKVGDVRFSLFTGPGFTLSDITIPEDPSIGIEPFAYVPSLEARIRILSLLHGRLEFSSLRLVDTTVNLTKSAGPWNFQLLLNRAHQPAESAALPDIEVRSGRLNFKFGDTKAVFYFDNADVDLNPRSDGRITFRFTGDPARTDRAGQSFGQFSGGGTWRRGGSAGSQLDLELNLERSPLEEAVRLFQERGIGVHGYVACSAHVSGPVSNLKIAGQFQVEDIHRWDLMPGKGGGWQVDFRGLWRPIEQELELETVGPGDTPLPVDLRFRAADYLTEPRWAGAVELHELPAAALLEVARHLGVALPDEVSLDGTLRGAIGYAKRRDGQGAWQGMMELEDAALKAPDATPIRSPRARFLIAGDTVRLEPGGIELDANQNLEVEGSFSASTRALELKFSTKGFSLAKPHSGLERLLGSASIPVLDNCRQGVWQGSVTYRAASDLEAHWQGSFELRNARIEIPGLADSVRVADASVTVDGPRIHVARLKGRAGPLVFQGDYRLEPGAVRPHKLNLKIPLASLADLEKLFAPALVRQQGFLARTLRFGRTAPIPDWLQTRRVDATIAVDDLAAAGADWEAARCRVLWDGTTVRLAALEARLDDSAVSGSLSIDLARATGPFYQFSGRVKNAPYKNGRLDLDGQLETEGTGLELALNARGEGEFHGHGITFTPDAGFRDISGCFNFRVASGVPRVRLTSVEAEQGLETFIGQGGTQPDGRILLDLSSGGRQVLLLGSLLAAAR